jgi:hypothetical protein
MDMLTGTVADDLLSGDLQAYNKPDASVGEELLGDIDGADEFAGEEFAGEEFAGGGELLGDAAIDGVLQRMGVRPPFTPAMRGRVRKVIKGSMKTGARRVIKRQERKLLQSTLTREMKFLLSQADKLDPETLKLLKLKNLELQDATFFAASQVAGNTGELTILDSTMIREYGVRDFQQGNLPQGINLILSKIRLEYGFSSAAVATAPSPKFITFFNTYNSVDSGPAVPTFTNVIPTGILNGYLIIYRNNRPIVQIPAADFLIVSNNSAVNYAQGFVDCKILGQMKLIKPTDTIRITLRTPDNGPAIPGASGNWSYLRVKLMGAATFQRD